MLNLAPWFYRNLLGENELFELIESFDIQLVTGEKVHEANVFLRKNKIPNWVSQSLLYKNCDGSGTSSFKNIAVYKAISEALERLAFYEMAETQEREFCFDLNPTTTGMAAYPHLISKYARQNAQAEATERWAIQQFNFNNLPVKKLESSIEGLEHFEIMTPFDFKVSLLAFRHKNFYAYGFAAGVDINHSFARAIIELDRNIRVLNKRSDLKIEIDTLSSSNEKTLSFFSTEIGFQLFQEKIKKSPSKIMANVPNILCDKELKGMWSQYTKVWRFLYDESYFPCHEDETFFMF